jgi:YHS domain-containing protein
MTMTTLEALERRIRERLAASEARWHAEQDELRRLMREMEAGQTGTADEAHPSPENRPDALCCLEGREERYARIAGRLMDEVICPRVEKLVSCFENAQEPGGRCGRHSCAYVFERTPRFPATATLEFGVTRDGLYRSLEVYHDVHVVPGYGAMPQPDRLSMPLEEVDEGAVAGWIENKILAFLDAYLRLETAEAYQEGNRVCDPVCGMRLNKVSAPARCEFRGYTFYFCTEGCRTRFLEEVANAGKASRQ